ncbi:MAG: serine hydrolase domain-containing protein [Planctomycetota bacterium]
MRQTSVPLVRTLVLWFGMSGPAMAQTPEKSTPGTTGTVADVSGFADGLREELGVPGLSLAATTANALIAVGYSGLRETGQDDLVQPGDPFHMGSLTKSMTATLFGTYVDEGRLDWDSTIEDLDPDLANQIPEPSRSITLRQLLSHRSGIRDDPDTNRLVTGLWSLEGTMIERRREASISALNAEWNKAPGDGYVYSNLGYVVAASLLERMEGHTWEDLVAERVFAPLGLGTVGHGPPGLGGEPGSTPNGHTLGSDGWESLPRVAGADNAPALGPAGRVHMSIEDLATFARFQLRGLLGADGLLESDTVRAMHDDSDSPGYALGWAVSSPGGTTRSMHSGSNTRWLAFVMVWPDRDIAVAIAMNAAPAAAMDGHSIALFVRDLARRKLIAPLSSRGSDRP